MVAVLIEPDIEPNPVVRADGLNFFYGEGDSRNQVLFDNNLEIMLRVLRETDLWELLHEPHGYSDDLP